MLVLVLAESFDNFSIGKLVSIKREINKKNEENSNLEKKNQELLKQIFKISNKQKQSNTSVFGDYYPDKKKDNQNKEIDDNVVQELLDSIGSSITITELEDNIKTDLKDRNLPYETPTDKILIRHLAGAQLALNLETIHNSIFGSQIRLLKELNTYSPQGMTTEEVNDYISNVFQQSQSSWNNWDNKKYLNYLFSGFLITKENNNTIHITNKGLDYLSWIVKNGKREDKGF